MDGRVLALDALLTAWERLRSVKIFSLPNGRELISRGKVTQNGVNTRGSGSQANSSAVAITYLRTGTPGHSRTTRPTWFERVPGLSFALIELVCAATSPPIYLHSTIDESCMLPNVHDLTSKWQIVQQLPGRTLGQPYSRPQVPLQYACIRLLQKRPARATIPTYARSTKVPLNRGLWSMAMSPCWC